MSKWLSSESKSNLCDSKAQALAIASAVAQSNQMKKADSPASRTLYLASVVAAELNLGAFQASSRVNAGFCKHGP